MGLGCCVCVDVHALRRVSFYMKRMQPLSRKGCLAALQICMLYASEEFESAPHVH